MSNSQSMLRFLLIALVVMAVAGSVVYVTVTFGSILAAVALAPPAVLLVAWAMNWLLPHSPGDPR